MKSQRKISLGRFAVSALVLIMAAPAARSADNGFFIGAAFGTQSTDHGWHATPTEIASIDDDSGLKVMGGFRPLDALAVEFDYIDLGRSSATLAWACADPTVLPCPVPELAVDASALSVSAAGIFPVGPVDLIGRAGLSRWRAQSLGPFEFKEIRKGTDITFGIGAQYRFRSFALRLELERYEFSDGSSDIASIGFTYTLP